MLQSGLSRTRMKPDAFGHFLRDNRGYGNGRRFRRRPPPWVAGGFPTRSKRDGNSTAGIDTVVSSERGRRS
jgi:hypothetical protein